MLVLDEPTAALDVRAEAALFDRFLEVTGGMTTLLVSHRLSSVRHADRIIVIGQDSIGQGRIIEDGTHDELLALGGVYARMFSLAGQALRHGGQRPARTRSPGRGRRRTGADAMRSLRGIGIVLAMSVRVSPWQTLVCLLESLARSSACFNPSTSPGSSTASYETTRPRWCSR